MIELNITYEGNVPGLAEHRLSIGQFGVPLRHLLFAVRRAANNMLRDAADRGEAKSGRLAAEADQIDIQIRSVREGSTDLDTCIAVVDPHDDPQMALWPEGLAEDAVSRVLDAIEKESKGVPRNSRVREYLRTLPFGLTRQYYALRVDGELRREVEVLAVRLPTEVDELPQLIEVVGKVVGVGFEPGRNFVRVKSSDASSSEITLNATATQVDRALEIREADVRVLALEPTSRLLRIERETDHRARLDVDAFVFAKWRNVLERLAH